MTTQIVDDRDVALRVGYQATEWREPIDEATYRMFLEDWSVQAIMRDNTCIGAVFRRGEELHVSVVPEWRRRWITRGVLRALFADRITRTRVTPGHEYMHGILSRLGFVQLDDGSFVKGH